MLSMSLLGEEPVSPRLAARLYPENRGAPRTAKERPVTLRATRNVPLDAMVENLSRTGFAMSTIADLGVGSVIGLSVGGALRRRVRIVRRVGFAYGCEFLLPLSDLEVSAALRSGDVVTADFLSDAGSSAIAEGFDRAETRKLSYLARAYILGALMVSLWGILIALAWPILR
ncbi:MAG: hypothetical protein JWR80_313 [Bradyrhizobium sp.]|nr:hypothetical protein [Bradyrhizobium sp.]